MALAPGTRIGTYQVLSLLGAGGMGEVYRARDDRLNRDVALKVMAASVASDPDRLARFRREAQVLGALNHPNIGHIYGFEDSAETHALVLELVEGPTLQEVIGGGLDLERALPIARQIVDALEAAHELGIVHRDLKPANVKVRDDGTVKVLDFGLAKALAPEAASAAADAMNSPTLTARATQVGMILGTAAYMAPEQAKGRVVDKRADIWAFGCVVYEMLTGKRAFEGEDASETMAAVLTREPDASALPAGTPGALRRLIGRCLTRDPRQRLRDIGDARFDLVEVERGTDVVSATGPAPATSRALVGVLATLTIASVSVALWLLLQPAPGVVPVQLSIALPEGHHLASGPSISRDGRRVAWVSSDGISRPQLYVRDLDQPVSRMLAGTEEAAHPFFSPDGRAIAFYARNKLFRINVDGGAPVPLADSTSSAGGAWTGAGKIIFKRTWNGPLQVINENGGTPEALVALEPGEYAHTWPYARPGSTDIFFASWGKAFDINRFDPKTKTRQPISAGWRRFVITPSGVLVTADPGNSDELQAMPLDGTTGARGQLTTVLERLDLGEGNGSARFDLADAGTLVYVPSSPIRRRLVTIDSQGRSSPSPAPESEYDEIRLSATGRQAAVVAGEKLSIVDLDRGAVTPLVPELGDRGARSSPIWSPDGRTVTFASNHEGNWEIFSKPATGAGTITAVHKQARDQFSLDYAPDGTLLFLTVEPETGTDLWLLEPKGSPRVVAATNAEENGGMFSPDGRFISYWSSVSGRQEVYVQSRANPADRLQVSVTGGEFAMWSPKGDRLFFRRGTAMMEVTINTTGKLSAGTPTELFNKGWALGRFGYDVSRLGNGFVMVEQPADAIRNRIEVVLNWFVRLDERMRSR